MQESNYTTHTVTSQDGTVIGYRKLGQGPGVVVLHGAFESAESHMELAETLMGTYTVYLPDRRGRAMSGPYNAKYSPQQDVEDMEAILSATGAHYAFGVSSGAVVWLAAARTLTAIHKMVLYEPALSINGSFDFCPGLKKYNDQMEQGNVAAAMVAAMKGAQLGPRILYIMPEWLVVWLTDRMLRGEKRHATQDQITMEELAPLFHYDGQLITEMGEQIDSLKAIQAETLLLSGSASPTYLKTAIDGLKSILPHADCLEFQGLDHSASGNTNRGGKPAVVAAELRRFFI
ncbi:hypothetical protein BZG36_01084 [Bifiguratus adelaidae]|uniref:AB hydrolase-1 domain-containing protein n=1 Tax=Bifiguratus adelaidae TaxID=1938954 RepID=A0A261Y632_9FUNG|nr:hypothetical protein BZG36_01084 [Bifiguratus adelaidae]